MPKQNSSSPTPIPVERRRRRVSTEGSVRERNSGISLKELVVWTNKVQFGVRAAKQEGSVMFGQLLSAKRRRRKTAAGSRWSLWEALAIPEKGRLIPAAWRNRGGKLSWKRPFDPSFLNALADTSARREANAGSEAAAFALFSYRVFGPRQAGSRMTLQLSGKMSGSFFGRFELQLARRPLPSAMEARRMTTLLPQDLQSCWFQASFNHVLKGGVPDAGTEGMRTVLCKQTTKVYSWKSKKIHQPRKPPAFKAIDIPTTTWSSKIVRRNSSLQVAQNLWKVRKTVRLCGNSTLSFPAQLRMATAASW